MAAGDNPFMTSRGRVTWQKEATFGASPASGAWQTFGYRVGDHRDPGPTNTWMSQRTWNSGREPVKLDLMSQDYGGVPLGEFKVTDPRILGFAWAQEVNAPSQIGATPYYRHTASPTTNATADSMAVQHHDQDAAGNASRTTYVGGVWAEVEVAGGEGGEVSYIPSPVFRKEDATIAANTVTEPTTASYKHHHGYVEVFGQQLLRVLSWRFRKVSAYTRARFWNSTEPLYAYEYPLEDVNYVVTMRAVADGKTFSGFGSRDILGLARNGDIGKAVLRFAKTVDQDEGKIVMGTADDALGIITAPRIRPAAGGRVVYELDFACRTSTYQWVDTSSTRYYSA